ncbi:MAG: rhodanese-like domain-containing protein [Lachnospiraceae bacterium]
MTTEAFVTMIWKQQKEEEGEEISSEQLLSLPDYGHRRGWLTDKDIIDWKSGVERRTAAGIVHEILRKERNEADEESWHGAEKLKDLYDCHTCVNHVAQVYAKGIMEPVEGDRFGMRRELTFEEAKEIVLRMFCRERRKPPKEAAEPPKGAALQSESETLQPEAAVRLSMQEAQKYLTKEKQALLIDVRTLREYEEWHLPGALLIPMADIIRNPYGITNDRKKPLLFYCRQGYQSEIAANCMAEAGYQKVFCFGLMI